MYMYTCIYACTRIHRSGFMESIYIYVAFRDQGSRHYWLHIYVGVCLYACVKIIYILACTYN